MSETKSTITEEVASHEMSSIHTVDLLGTSTSAQCIIAMSMDVTQRHSRLREKREAWKKRVGHPEPFSLNIKEILRTAEHPTHRFDPHLVPDRKLAEYRIILKGGPFRYEPDILPDIPEEREERDGDTGRRREHTEDQARHNFARVFTKPKSRVAAMVAVADRDASEVELSVVRVEAGTSAVRQGKSTGKRKWKYPKRLERFY